MVAQRDKSILLVFAVLGIASFGCCQYRASDAHRMALFRAHKAEYETVLSMLGHDRGLTFINKALTEPDDPKTVGISPRRVEEYRKYMSKIDCGAIRYEPVLGSVVFVAGSANAAGIFYFPVSSFPSGRKYGIPADSRRIEGDWFIDTRTHEL
jgi:hypothetical protein